MSWASVVKRNTASVVKRNTEKPVEPPPAPLQDYLKQEQKSLAESLAAIEKENASQCRPTCVMLKRPDAPQTIPIFKTRDDMCQWENDEFWKNVHKIENGQEAP